MFLLLVIPIPSVAQNRYGTPASATFVNTYVPMSHDEMLLMAAAKVWKEEQDQEIFDRYSQTAYEYLKKRQINYFVNYAHAALNTGYFNSLLYYNLGISYCLLGQKGKSKKDLKKASKKRFP